MIRLLLVSFFTILSSLSTNAHERKMVSVLPSCNKQWYTHSLQGVMNKTYGDYRIINMPLRVCL